MLKSTIKRQIITEIDPNRRPADFKEGKFFILITGGSASGKSVINEHVFERLSEMGYKRDYVCKLGSYSFEGILSNPLVRGFRNMIYRFFMQSTAEQQAATGETKENNNLVTQVLNESMEAAFKQGSPVVFDARSYKGHIFFDALAKAKAQGYETILISPHITAEKYFQRVHERKRRTGRPVDFERGLECHKVFAEQLDDFIAKTDVTILLDNNRDYGPPTPILVSLKGKKYILDAEAYADVKRKAQLNPKAKTEGDLWPDKRSTGGAGATDGGSVEQGVAESTTIRADAERGLGRDGFAQRILNDYLTADKPRQV